jgi:hypothetical protein
MREEMGRAARLYAEEHLGREQVLLRFELEMRLLTESETREVRSAPRSKAPAPRPD